MKDLEIYYLSLESSIERHEALQANYASCDIKPHWTLNRLIAFEKHHAPVQAMKGALAPGGKGAWFSLQEAVRRSMASDRHVMVMDDDSEFCSLTQPLIDIILGNITDDAAWDLLYTDTIVPNAIDMPRFLYERRIYEQTGQINVLDLPCGPFRTIAGNVIINRRSKQKFLDLTTLESYDTPFDLYMRTLLETKQLKGSLLFPFVMAPSSLADDSTLKQVDDKNYVGAGRWEHALHNDFRRMIWVGRKDEVYFNTPPIYAGVDMSAHVRLDVLRLTELMKPLLSGMMTYKP